MDSEFYLWKNKVDKIVHKKIGYHLDELEDELYRDYFDGGYSNEYMANIVINSFNSILM
jgi:hypothetical protein